MARTLESARRKIIATLERTTSRTYPVPPIALVTGPRLEISSGDPDALFFIASIDKVFIATLIAQLFDEGRFQPDTPIGRLLPADDLAPLPVAPGVDNARNVTVEHLLAHTSGLPDVILPPRGYRTACSITELRTNAGRAWTIPELLAQSSHLPPVGRPGERFRYGDTGYFLLIRIIEEARGTGFAEQLVTRLFEPAGMSRTAAWATSDRGDAEAAVHEIAPFWLDRPGPDDRNLLAPNLYWDSGVGGPSTANDLVRFQRELHEGRLLDPRWIPLLSARRHRFRPGVHYGAGMVTLRFGGFSPMLRGHPEPIGGLGVTATHLFYYPRQQTHLVLNYHAGRRMSASFQMHIRLAGLIHRHG